MIQKETQKSVVDLSKIFQRKKLTSQFVFLLDIMIVQWL